MRSHQRKHSCDWKRELHGWFTDVPGTLQGLSDYPTLKAPTSINKLKSQGGWVVFQNIDGLNVLGGGTFDGQGTVAWSKNNCAKTGKCYSLPAVSPNAGINVSTQRSQFILVRICF